MTFGANQPFQDKYLIELKQAGLNELYSKCKFLEEFKHNPSMSKKDEWIAVGSVLVDLGQVGILEWEKLSRADSSNWDCLEYANMLSRIQNGIINEKTCNEIRKKASGCKGCNIYKKPRDILLDYAANRPQGVISSTRTPIDETVARVILEADIKKLLGQLGVNVYHFGAPNGIGKSTSLINSLNTVVNSKKILFLVPRQNLAEQIEKDIEKAVGSKEVVRLISREKLFKSGLIKCPIRGNYKYLIACNSLGYPFNHMYCSQCNRKKCNYKNRLKDSAIKKVVIGVHSHMQYDTVWDIVKPDLLIIDECFISSFRQEITFTDNAIDFTEMIVNKANIPQQEKHNILKSITDLKACSVPFWPSSYEKNNDIVKAFAQEILANIANNKGPTGSFLFNALAYMNRKKISAQLINKKYSYIRTAEIPSNIPLIILDSTGNNYHYHSLLGRSVTSCSLKNDEDIKHHVMVTQILDGRYPLSTLYNKSSDGLKKTSTRLLCLMASILSGKKWNMITLKKVSSYILKNLHQLTGGGLVTYFGNVSGLNSLKDADVVTILGYKLLGDVNLVNTARVKYNTGWNETAIIAQAQKTRQDALTANYEYINFDDDYLRIKVLSSSYSEKCVQYVKEIVEQGDYIQALGRIRPYSTRKPTSISGLQHRQLYVLSNQPTGPIPVDRAITYDKLIEKFIFPARNTQRDTLRVLVELIGAGVTKIDAIKEDIFIAKAQEMGINILSWKTVRSQLSERNNSKYRYEHTVSCLIKNPTLRYLLLEHDYDNKTDKDILSHTLAVHSAATKGEDEDIAAAAVIEINRLVIESKCNKLEKLINDNSFLKLTNEEKIKRMISVIEKEMVIGQTELKIKLLGILSRFGNDQGEDVNPDFDNIFEEYDDDVIT